MISKTQKLISIFWPSFLVAGLGTILLFTAIDPEEMISPVWLVDLPRLEIYTIGFLFLWVLGIMASRNLGRTTVTRVMIDPVIAQCPVLVNGVFNVRLG